MKEIENFIAKYMRARGWDDQPPAGLAKSISIESAELLEHFQWSEPTTAELKKDKEKFTAVQKELADVLIYCIDMCTVLGLDAEKIIRAKMRHNIKKYPAKKILKDKNAAAEIHFAHRAQRLTTAEAKK